MGRYRNVPYAHIGSIRNTRSYPEGGIDVTSGSGTQVADRNRDVTYRVILDPIGNYH